MQEVEELTEKYNPADHSISQAKTKLSELTARHSQVLKEFNAKHADHCNARTDALQVCEEMTPSESVEQLKKQLRVSRQSLEEVSGLLFVSPPTDRKSPRGE